MGLKKRFNQRGSNQRGSTFRRNEKFSTGKFTNKDNSNANSYYGCGMTGHLLKDCPLIQKDRRKSNVKMNKDNKKAMVFA